MAVSPCTILPVLEMKHVGLPPAHIEAPSTSRCLLSAHGCMSSSPEPEMLVWLVWGAQLVKATLDARHGWLPRRFWPVRKYPWGTCEALSSEHSDFAALKKLLLETSFEELKEETERRYYRFREEELLNLTDPDTG